MGARLEPGEEHSLVPPQPLHIIFFYHSVVSDWNNGNAHFLRGIVKELTLRSHHVVVYEPRNNWSIENLKVETGCDAEVEENFSDAFPQIQYVRYKPELLQLDEVLDTADVVIVHEWNDHSLVSDIGRHHSRNPHYKLLFHDTHHRSVTDPAAMAAYDLSHYDGVLAFGSIVRDLYLVKSWIHRAWTWHEAADTDLFYPHESDRNKGDLLWIGNWGDEERTAELHQYFFEPASRLGLACAAFGVRYPQAALDVLQAAGIRYGGWLPNQQVPHQAAQYSAMIHVPRRPYVQALPGIPTIRPFEAMACGIPLVSAWWDDSENLFSAGEDYLLSRDPADMRQNIQDVLADKGAAQAMAVKALHTIRSRHTCAHRVDELMQILSELEIFTPSRIAEPCPANLL